MGVAAVYLEDCIRDKQPCQTIKSNPPKMKLPSPNPKPSRSTHTRTHPNRQKLNYKSDPNNVPNPIRTESKRQANKLVMGQVKILKRGEQFSEAVEREKVLPLPGMYAGSLTVLPPPSSVLLPLFITKKIVTVSDATSDLPRILRLDFP